MKRGFTITELLIVIGIIVLLAALLLPTISKAWQSASNARAVSDMRTIQIAIAAYRQDFNDIPRVPDANLGSGANMLADLGNPNVLYGAELLCWSLIAPYRDKYNVGETPAPFDPLDGAFGPGFRVNPRTSPTVSPRGTVYGPYLDVDTYMPSTHPQIPRYFVLLDNVGEPIMYIPRRKAITNPAGRSIATDPSFGYGGRNGSAMWDFRYVEPAFSQAQDGSDFNERFARFLVSMGDLNANGYLDTDATGNIIGGEKLEQGEYILWSVGADHIYGTSDDVKVMP